MKLRSAGLSALAILGLAAPTLADTVYVPLATDIVIDGIRYQTQVTATNQGLATRRFSTYFIPAGSNGGERPDGGEERTVFAVNGNSSILVAPVTDDDDQTGVLEIAGAPQVLIGARLVPIIGESTQVGANIPVVSSLTAFAPNRTVFLNNIDRSGEVVTDFNIFNVGKSAASCTVSAQKADGSSLSANTTTTVQALSLQRFADVLQILGQQNLQDARIIVTCNQSFFAYALTFDKRSGEATVVSPSESLTSTLTRPGDSGGGPGPDPTCSNNAVACISRPGTFHQPTNNQNDVLRLVTDVPPGQYDLLKVNVRVFHGGWKNPSSGLHNIFWIVRDRNFDMYGYVNFRGPGSDLLLWRHGLGLSAPAKFKIEIPFQFAPFTTYDVEYIFDTGNQRITLNVRDQAGNLLVSGTDDPNVNHINFDAGQNQQIVIDFGFQGDNDNEPQQFGWNWQDLKVELFD